jgi:putative transposase
LARSIEERRAMISLDEALSVRRQCELLGVERSGLYYRASGPHARELDLRARLDRIYMDYPFYGVRRMALELADEGAPANVKMVRRLLRQMGLMALYPKPRLSQPAPGAQARPYLLRELKIERPHQVWAIDITYVPLRSGFGYLAAVLEWASRYVLAWELSNTLETSFCLRALHRAVEVAGTVADIFNSDQGSQFTGGEWIGAVEGYGMRVSHDGRGRALDNIMIERLWRSVKYEDIYLHAYETLPQARAGLARYFPFYNERRRHQSLDDRTPAEVLKHGTHKTEPSEAGPGLPPPASAVRMFTENQT